jgi:hypothetical protein
MISGLHAGTGSELILVNNASATMPAHGRRPAQRPPIGYKERAGAPEAASPVRDAALSLGTGGRDGHRQSAGFANEVCCRSTR